MVLPRWPWKILPCSAPFPVLLASTHPMLFPARGPLSWLPTTRGSPLPARPGLRHLSSTATMRSLRSERERYGASVRMFLICLFTLGSFSLFFSPFPSLPPFFVFVVVCLFFLLLLIMLQLANKLRLFLFLLGRASDYH